MNVEINQNAESVKLLVNRLKSNRPPIAFLGAGVSVGAQYPSWSALMGQLHQKALERVSQDAGGNAKNVSPKYLKQLETDGDFPWRAEEYKRLLKEDFYSFLDQIFSAEGRTPSLLAQKIAQSKFRHMVTTNWDQTFENALKGRRGENEVRTVDWGVEDDVKVFIRELANDTDVTYCVYLHGRHPESQSFIVSNGDYIGRYSSTDWTTRKLFAIFLTQTIVFIGYSLNDPDLTHLLRIANTHLPSDSPNHFIFLPLDSDQDERLIFNKYRALFGITPIFYRKTPDHAELVKLLEEIGAAVDSVAPMERLVIAESMNRDFGYVAESADDPHKGKFGGINSKDGVTLSASVTAADSTDWFSVTLQVNGANLEGEVTFYLHDTFVPATRVVSCENNAAKLDLWSYGAFTVGALIEPGGLRLELDLAELETAPKVFRMR